MTNSRQQFDAALDALLRDAERQGFNRGIQVAERIVGWLSTPTQSEHIADVRMWASVAIAKAEKRQGTSV